MAEEDKLNLVFDTQIPPRHQASFRFDLKRSVAKQNTLQVKLLYCLIILSFSSPRSFSPPRLIRRALGYNRRGGRNGLAV
jgi:hypothetical protein